MIGHRRAIAGVGAAVALALAAGLGFLHLGGRASPLDAIEAAAFDLRLLLTGPLPQRGDVVVVAIDERAIDALGGIYPLSRESLARIVEAVVAAAPRAVALDVVLATETERDLPLATALARLPATIGAAATFAGEATTNLPVAADVLWPAARFAAAAQPGMVNLSISATGTPQHVPVVTLTRNGVAIHLCVRAAALFLGAEPRLAPDLLTVGETRASLDPGASLPVRIAGPSGTLPTVSAADLLAGRGGGALEGRLAFIGFTAAAVGDTFESPFGEGIPGVEVLAAATADLIAGETLGRSRAVRRADVAAAALVGLAAVGLVTFAPLAVGLVATVILLASGFLAATLLFAAGIWVSVALPLAVAVPALAAAWILRTRAERRTAQEEHRALQRLARLHPPALARRLALDPDFLAEPVTLRLGIVFVDIAGYTGISEALGLNSTQKMLQDFHLVVARVVEAHGGVLMNFMGDGALAVFGLPDPAADDARRALTAAIDLVRAVQAMPPPMATAPLDARTGVHLADVAVSRLGPTAHQHVTVTGDGVNLANRLISVAKDAGMRVAASAELLDAAGGAGLPPPDERLTTAIRGRAAGAEVAAWRLAPERRLAPEDLAPTSVLSATAPEPR